MGNGQVGCQSQGAKPRLEQAPRHGNEADAPSRAPRGTGGLGGLLDGRDTVLADGPLRAGTCAADHTLPRLRRAPAVHARRQEGAGN